jgi:hypothetical protein
MLARGARSTLARLMSTPRALACGAVVSVLASAACGGRAENVSPSPGPSEDDAATGGATEDVTAASADSGASADSAGATVVVSEFPLGDYACNSTFDFGPGIPLPAGIAALAPGTLTLSLSGSVLTAVYTSIPSAADPTASGALDFTLSTGKTASPAAADQTFEVQCTPDGQFAPPSDTVDVTSGTLTLDTSTLFLGFAGTFVGGGGSGDLCQGQPLIASFVCTKQ